MTEIESGIPSLAKMPAPNTAIPTMLRAIGDSTNDQDLVLLPVTFFYVNGLLMVVINTSIPILLS